MTVSWSGITSRPWRSVSSPVLTTTVSAVADVPPGGRAPASRPPTPPASATTRRRHALRAARATSPIRSIVSRSYGAGMPDDDGAGSPSSTIRPERVGDLRPASRAGRRRSSMSSTPLPASDRRVARPRPPRGVADDDREADRSSRSSPGRARRRRSARARIASLRADLVDRAAIVFQRVAVARDGPQRLLRPGAADQDRQVRPGPGAARRARRGTCRSGPSWLNRSPSSSRRMSITDSSSRSSRSPNAAAEVDAEARRARARTRRRRCRGSPGRRERWSSVVASFAVRPGLRNVLAPTISPSRIARS